MDHSKHIAELRLFNVILTTAPAFNEFGMVGVRLNAILDWPIGTTTGHAVFLNPKVNAMFKCMLEKWAHLLKSPGSATVLKDSNDSWFRKHALEAMRHASRGDKLWTFESEYICDAKAKHYGFTSWDDFFTRRFHIQGRPVAGENGNNIVFNACESEGPRHFLDQIAALQSRSHS